MKKISILFLQLVVVVIGIGALSFMLWEPHLEGRNVNATLSEIYFKDPFLVYAYTTSIAFFVALYQAFTLLGLIGRNEAFSQSALKALRTIKYCTSILIVSLLGALGYLFIVQRKVEEDIAGGVFMGLLIIFASAVIAAAATVFEGLLQRAIDIAPENRA